MTVQGRLVVGGARKGVTTIGLFDSGVGGLSIWKALVLLMPHVGTRYVADQAWCPYGSRSPEEIRERSLRIASFLLGQGSELLVVACNTATTQAIAHLRQHLEVPLVGIEPATKPAALQTRTGHIAVLATPGTLRSEHYLHTLQRHAPHCHVSELVVPELVPLVEAGIWEGEALESVLGGHLDRLCGQGVDHLILGCTHYPFLRPWIEARMGERLRVLDPSAAVAARVRSLCGEGQPSDAGGAGHRFWSSGDNGTLGRMLMCWGVEAPVLPLSLEAGVLDVSPQGLL